MFNSQLARWALFFGAACVVPYALQARMGKVFFSSTRWLKGDIQIQAREDGQEIVIIALPSGSVVVPRSEIKTIIYAPESRLASAPGSELIRALESGRKSGAARRSAKSNPAFPPLYDPYIRAASSKNRLDPNLVKAVIRQESNFNSRDVSGKGAQGLMQLMPDTARVLGVQDAFDPWENIHGGTRYLRDMLDLFDGDLVKALAAYNAGPAAVRKYGTVPPYRETRTYVRKVLDYYHRSRPASLFAFEDPQGRLVFSDRPYVP